MAFWYAIGWMIGLVTVAALYAHGTFGKASSGVPFSALASTWAGALGGIAISLKGVYDHWTDNSNHPYGKTAWNNENLLWHLGRPASGAIAGLAVFILLKAVYPSGSPSAGAMAAAAFVLGVQEKRFFAWIKQVGAVVLTLPANRKEPPADNDEAASSDSHDESGG